MDRKPLGTTGLEVTCLGFGAFKIGRNEGIKYPHAYDLPDEPAVERLLNGVLDLGITLIDTAPAYGLSEERIGRAIGHRRKDFVLSTKVGETFAEGKSNYAFTGEAFRLSIERSLHRLRTDVLDIVLIHSDGRDLAIQHETDCIPALLDLKTAGLVRAVGLSGKTVEGATAALDWADVLMIEYHLSDTSHAAVMREARARGKGVIVKKGLASGHLDPAASLRFVLAEPSVDTVVVGGLNLEHMRGNIAVARQVRPPVRS